jgi:hypothetical protein
LIDVKKHILRAVLRAIYVQFHEDPVMALP